VMPSFGSASMLDLQLDLTAILTVRRLVNEASPPPFSFRGLARKSTRSLVKGRA